MNTLRVKPGYRTSEFWLTLVSFLFSGLYLVGLLDNHNQKEDLINETSRGVEAAILILGQLTVLFRYIKGRTEIKKTWWNTVSNENKIINKQPDQTEPSHIDSKNDKPRKSKPKKPTTRTSKKQPRKSK